MFSEPVLMEDCGAGLVLGELAATSQQVSIVKSLDRVPATQYEFTRLLSIEPDLVFLDLRTPESALDLVRTIRGCNATTAIVGLSSNMPASWRTRFDDAGAAHVFAVSTTPATIQS